MNTSSVSDLFYFTPDTLPLHQLPVKTESSSSPDLPPTPTSLHHSQFQFHSTPSSTHSSHSPSRNTSEAPTTAPQHSIFRFGSDTAAFALMSNQSWPASATHSRYPSLGSSTGFDDSNAYELGTMQDFADEYDDLSELVDLPVNYGLVSESNLDPSGEKTIRRRSSKGMFICTAQ